MKALWRRLLSLGLWPRMALAISAGFLVLFFIFSLLSEQALRDSTRNVLDERLVIAQMAATQLDSALGQAIEELEDAIRFADFDTDDSNLETERDVLAHTYGRRSIFSPGITFLDTDGIVVLSHPEQLYEAQTDLSDLPYINDALNQRQSIISEPFGDPLSQKPVVAVVVPVYDGTEFLGLLMGLLDLTDKALSRPLEHAATVDQTGHAVLVDSYGRTLASTFGASFLVEADHATFYRGALLESQTVVRTVPTEWEHDDKTDSLHVMAFAPIETTSWGVAVGGTQAEIFAGVRRLRLGLIVLGTIALAGTWTATLVGTRFLIRPVERMTAAAQRVAAGELDTPIYAPEGGEITTLAGALEQMRLQLLADIEKLARWNEELEARVGRRTQDLHQQQTLTKQLLRRVINAQEEERARLAREMHDDIGQTLTAVQINLDRLAKSARVEREDVADQIDKVRKLVTQALSDLRRVIADVRPGVLDQLGLIPALTWIADHTLRPLGLEINFNVEDTEKRLPEEIEITLFRIAQEAMSNVARHSEAQHLSVDLVWQNGKVTMTLSDDGKGFDPAAIVMRPDCQLGLAGMKERASLTGGHVMIESAPNKGTIVRTVIPVPNTIFVKGDAQFE